MLYSKTKSVIQFYIKILTLFIFSCFAAGSFAQPAEIRKDSIVETFYSINNAPLYWFSSRRDVKRANEWLTTFESTDQTGFVPEQQQINQIRSALSNRKQIDKSKIEKTDRQITSLILSFIKDRQKANVHFEYDEVSVQRDSATIYLLRNARYKETVSKFISRLDCQDHDYLVLKKFLKDSIPDKNSLRYKSVVLSMNYLKYLSVNHQPEYIVANIPETEVRYYQNNRLTLKMKAVVGKKKNPTPTIASYITNIVTFPLWNVPFSIASKELLPKVQKDESYLERNNFEVVDAKGNAIDDSDLNWDSYTEKNFPYFFRESTGPNNSLGVLKFNLGNPFSIYLHDTNSKGAFKKENRFLSHGCVRLEKPIELADLLTKGKIDIEALKSGKKDTESKIIKLAKKVPVFIIYMPVTVDGEKVTFLKDVYGLVK